MERGERVREEEGEVGGRRAEKDVGGGGGGEDRRMMWELEEVSLSTV